MNEIRVPGLTVIIGPKTGKVTTEPNDIVAPVAVVEDDALAIATRAAAAIDALVQAFTTSKASTFAELRNELAQTAAAVELANTIDPEVSP